jgi:hypothetical protein
MGGKRLTHLAQERRHAFGWHSLRGPAQEHAAAYLDLGIDMIHFKRHRSLERCAEMRMLLQAENDVVPPATPKRPARPPGPRYLEIQTARRAFAG